ncbi:DegQ family serine endoprotease [Candidatus Nitronereus thalassa]|uniref:DegQ family serine endoprotease n=1 Tax=Candidatus Nitronereus thalassa TaxID=3020898 RepID=A0ABU3KAF9_9BACT|nr:DegQ family serine endoprotease [Candidatus Nitronereus thalassa]MDT7043298.1 DegQ family serine endoprotease [Candidatus Nitronereus thalassa]
MKPFPESISMPIWFRGLLACFLLAVTVQCSETPQDTPQISSSTIPTVLPTSTQDPMPTAQPVGVPFPANETFIRVSKAAMASVVNISSTRKKEETSQRSPSPFFDDPLFRRFFGEEFEHRFRQQEPRRQEQGLGSGVIVSQDGYIITNNHVVEQADELMVLLGDKRKFPAKLIGTDPKTDLAVIKIAEKGLPTLQWGDSRNLQVGELVLAVGNPFGLNQTVTMGIISAIGRANMGIVDYEDFIQTDAAINPGNSGGALVNLQGHLIGINTAIFSRTGGYMGIGFAIPSNMVKNIMNNLVNHGKVIRGWLGVSIQELNPELAEQFGSPDTAGALVGDVIKGSPADGAGVQRGDIIRKYDGRAVKDPTHLRSLVAETTPGARASVTVLRNNATKELLVSIEELPKNLTANRKPAEDPMKSHVLSGIRVEPLPPDRDSNEEGVMISHVQPDSAANRAGLRRGDIILEMNRSPIHNVDDFYEISDHLEAQAPVLVLLKRGNGTIYLSIKPNP